MKQDRRIVDETEARMACWLCWRVQGARQRGWFRNLFAVLEGCLAAETCLAAFRVWASRHPTGGEAVTEPDAQKRRGLQMMLEDVIGTLTRGGFCRTFGTGEEQRVRRNYGTEEPSGKSKHLDKAEDTAWETVRQWSVESQPHDLQELIDDLTHSHGKRLDELDISFVAHAEFQDAEWRPKKCRVLRQDGRWQLWPLPEAWRVVDLPVHWLRPHQEAAKVPFMRAEEWAAFAPDVKARGVQEAVVVQVGGDVLDGRCRLQAAQEGGRQTVPARVVDLSPIEQVLYVYRAAALRRHLNDDQRAILAARYRELLSEAARKARAQKGGQAGGRGRRKADSSQDTAPQKLSEDAAQAAGASTRQQAAALHNVPERKLRTAIEVERKDPELADKVLAGDMTLNLAKRQQQGAGGGEAEGPRPDAGLAGSDRQSARGAAEPGDGAGGAGRQGTDGWTQLVQTLDKIDGLLDGSMGEVEALAQQLSTEARAGLGDRLRQLRAKVDRMARALAKGGATRRPSPASSRAVPWGYC
jgi:ParB-like chromosome segregation protein Spo0J